MLSNASALQIFQLLRVGSTILTGVVLAKSGLPTGEIGAFEALLFIGTTASFFWVNGLLQGIAPMYAKQSEPGKKAFVASVFLIFCGISIVLFGLLTLFSAEIIPLLSGKTSLPNYGLFCLYLLFNLPSYPVEYYYLVWSRPNSILAWGLLVFMGHLLCVGVPLFLGYPFVYSFYALVGFSIFKCAWAAFLAFSGGAITFDLVLVRRYLLFSWPLVISALVSNFMVLWDNWLVTHRSEDLAVFAIYRYGARELPLALPLCTALGTAMIPGIVQNAAQGMAELRKRSVWLMHLLFPLSIGLLFCSSWIYPRVFNPDFAGSAPIFNVFLLSIANRILLPGPILLSKSDTRVFILISIVELLFRVLLSLLFYQFWGIIGIAWGVTLSFWVEKIALSWRLYRGHGIGPAQWVDLRWYSFYLLALAGAFYLTT